MHNKIYVSRKLKTTYILKQKNSTVAGSNQNSMTDANSLGKAGRQAHHMPLGSRVPLQSLLAHGARPGIPQSTSRELIEDRTY